MVDAGENNELKVKFRLPEVSVGSWPTRVSVGGGLRLAGTGVCIDAPNGPRFNISLTVESLDGELYAGASLALGLNGSVSTVTFASALARAEAGLSTT